MPRAMQWITKLQSWTTLAAGAQQANQLDTQLLQRQGATLTRLVGFIDVGPAAAALRTQVAWGIIIMDQTAFAAGSFPSPIVPTQVPWCYWEAHEFLRFGITTGESRERFRFDIRGQRKYGIRDDILTFVIDNAAGGSSVNGLLSLRALFRLG